MITTAFENTRSQAGDAARSRRDAADGIVELAAHLSGPDRALLESIYERGMTAASVARMIGQRPRTVQLRVQRLLKHLSSPMFSFVLRHRSAWPAQRRRVGDAIYLRGETQRTAAARLRLTVHQVRCEADRIRTIAEQATTSRHAHRSEPASCA